MKKVILLFALSLLIFSCKKEKTNTEKELINEHSLEESLDWEGSYFGTLPCASCKGENTFITLSSNGTYIKEIERLGTDKKTDSHQGNFKWSKDGCNVILDDETEFRIGKEALFLVSKNGEKIPKEQASNYMLKKTEIKSCTDNYDENIHLKNYKGNNGKAYKIIYDTNTENPTALITTDSFSKKLVQTTAWSKGAEYELDGYKLVSKGDNASLFINGKTIKLKSVK